MAVVFLVLLDDLEVRLDSRNWALKAALRCWPSRHRLHGAVLVGAEAEPDQWLGLVVAGVFLVLLDGPKARLDSRYWALKTALRCWSSRRQLHGTVLGGAEA